MSPRLFLVSGLALVAAVPVVAGLNGTKAGGATLAEVFSTPQPYTTPLRLARTPKMDGVFRKEEWDLLWGTLPLKEPFPPETSAPLSGAIGPIPGGPAATSPTPGAPVVSTVGAPSAGAATSGAIGSPVAPTPLSSTAPVQSGGTTGTTGTAPLAPINLQPIPTQPAAVAATLLPAQAGFMSWEPGKLYFAALLSPGNDMLVTIDAGNNGFLIGNDNLEVRVTPGSPAVVRARILDATFAAGPAWIDASGFVQASTAISAPRSDGSVFVELAVCDPGYNILRTQLKDEFGLRLDSVATSAPQAEAFLPRVTSKVRLSDQRVTNMPAGMDAAVAAKGRTVLPGGSTSVRWLLTGTDATPVKYLEIGGEGSLGDQVNFLRVPSPIFDPRGQSTVDYPTRVIPSAAQGYAVLKGEVTGSGWGSALIESSIRIAPPMDIVAPAKHLVGAGKALSITCKADVVSNTDQRIEGNFQVLPPSGWKVVDGTDKNFFIYDKGAKANRQFVLAAPAGVHGTYKAIIRIVALGGVIDQPYWVTIL